MFRISTDQFQYDSATKTFSAESSSLRDLRLSRIYPDSADLGFVLVSAKTGREVLVSLSREERDRENELLYTEFTPTKPTGFRKIIIFND